MTDEIICTNEGTWRIFNYNVIIILISSESDCSQKYPFPRYCCSVSHRLCLDIAPRHSTLLIYRSNLILTRLNSNIVSRDDCTSARLTGDIAELTFGNRRCVQSFRRTPISAVPLFFVAKARAKLLSRTTFHEKPILRREL